MILHSVSYGPPDAPVLVFLGSIASTTDMWLPQLDEFSRDHRVIALDHRGHGSSPAPDLAPGQTTIDTLAGDVVETLDSLGVGKCGVVGLSLGGALAQYLTLTSERVTKAAYLCTAPYFGGPDKWEPRAQLTRAEGMAPMVDAVSNLWFSADWATTHPATFGRFRRMIGSTSGEGYAACADALAGWDIRARLCEITVPVLTLAGASDESTPPDTVHAIALGVSGEARTVTVPGAHIPTIESPAAVNRALREFLTE